MLKELSSLLNFKMNIVEMSKDGYGHVINHSWVEDGIMGALKNYQVEIGMCNIWSDLANIPVLDFAPFNNLVRKELFAFLQRCYYFFGCLLVLKIH